MIELIIVWYVLMPPTAREPDGFISERVTRIRAESARECEQSARSIRGAKMVAMATCEGFER